MNDELHHKVTANRTDLLSRGSKKLVEIRQRRKEDMEICRNFKVIRELI